MSRVSAETRRVLKSASPVHVVVELRSPDGRQLLVLGATHVKTRRASEICRRAFQGFSLRGVGRFQRDQVFAGRLLGAPLDRSWG